MLTKRHLKYQKRMSFGTPEMCLTNHRLRDKNTLSQKLIVRISRFHEFCTAKWCFITDVYDTVLLLIIKYADRIFSLIISGQITCLRLGSENYINSSVFCIWMIPSEVFGRNSCQKNVIFCTAIHL